MTTNATETVLPRIGERMDEPEKFRALPQGSSIYSDTMSRNWWVKVEDNSWVHVSNPDRTPSLEERRYADVDFGRSFIVRSIATVGSRLDGCSVGVPIGTRVSNAASPQTFIKTAEDQWRRIEGHSLIESEGVLPNSNFVSGWTITALPTGSVDSITGRVLIPLTVDQFAALDIGSEFIVSGRRYRMGSGGGVTILDSQPVTVIPADVFTGAVSAGSAWVLGEQAAPTESTEGNQVESGEMVTALREEIGRLQQRITTLENQRDAQARWADSFREALTSAAQGDDIAFDSRVNQTIREYGGDGIEPDMEDVVVTIDIEGVTETDLEDHIGRSGIEEIINESRDLEWTNDRVTQVTLEWSHSTSTQFEVEEGTCACHLVDNDWVGQYLDSNGFSYSDFSFQVFCEHD